jgi:hypothetical protein
MSSNLSEQGVRRTAERKGYRLQKLRGDDRYLLFCNLSGGLCVGEVDARGVYIGYSLDAVEDWLTG